MNNFKFIIILLLLIYEFDDIILKIKTLQISYKYVLKDILFS